MKKISLIFVVFSILALVLVGACGGDNGDNGDTEETTTAQTTTPQTSDEPEPTEPSNGGNGGGGGLTWDDMPIYGGVDQIEEFSMTFSPDEGDYSEFEWRYYETGADIDDVIDFYKDEMPDNGWDEQMWMDAGEVAYGMYFKNNEKDAAMVWIAAEEGDTLIGLWRASE
jgi:hypothetical protein